MLSYGLSVKAYGSRMAYSLKYQPEISLPFYGLREPSLSPVAGEIRNGFPAAGNSRLVYLFLIRPFTGGEIP